MNLLFYDGLVLRITTFLLRSDIVFAFNLVTCVCEIILICIDQLLCSRLWTEQGLQTVYFQHLVRLFQPVVHFKGFGEFFIILNTITEIL